MQFANTLQFGIFSIAYLIIVLQAYFSRVYSHLAKFIKFKHSFISQIFTWMTKLVLASVQILLAAHFV